MSRRQVYTLLEPNPSNDEATVLVTLRGDLLDRLRNFASDYHDADLERALDALFRDAVIAAGEVPA